MSNSDGGTKDAESIERKLKQRPALAKTDSNKHASYGLLYGQDDAGDLHPGIDRSDQSVSHDELADQLFGDVDGPSNLAFALKKQV